MVVNCDISCGCQLDQKDHIFWLSQLVLLLKQKKPTYPFVHPASQVSSFPLSFSSQNAMIRYCLHAPETKLTWVVPSVFP